MIAEEVVITQLSLDDKVTMVDGPEVEEDARTVSSDGGLPQSQSTSIEADSEDEFEDAVEPPSSTSGVLMAFDGVAPPLSGVYEDALEATEQQVAAALESTNSDGSGGQSAIQEEEEGAETETAEIEAKVVAAVEELVELATSGAVDITEACSAEVAELTEEDVNAQAEEGPVEQENQNDTVQDAGGDAIVEQHAEELESRQEALEEEGLVDESAADEHSTSEEIAFEDSRDSSDDNEEASTLDTPAVRETTEAEQPSTPDEVEAAPEVIATADAEEVIPCDQDAIDCVDKTGETDNESCGNVECGDSQDERVDESQETTVTDAEVELESPEVHPASEQTSESEHSTPTIGAVLESEESESTTQEDIAGEPMDDAVDEAEKVAATEFGSQDEPAAEEVGKREPMASADEQATPQKSTASPDDSVTEVADGDSVDGTEQEPSQPEESVNTVHIGEKADAEEIIPQAANDPVEAVQAEVEENLQADLDPSEAASSDTDVKLEQCDTELATPEDNNIATSDLAEEELEAPPALREAPTSSSRKSSDHEQLEREHGRNLAAVSLLPRLAPSSGTTTTTTTTIEPFILSSESNEMLEGHFPPQRFTFEVFGFSIDKRVVYYHVHRSDRRMGFREPAILKRYTDFRELQTQLLDSCLRVAADMPRIPKPHLGTVLRGYRSKRTIEVREKAFRALLRYIAQYPALHGSAIFERFITTSRATSGPAWM